MSWEVTPCIATLNKSRFQIEHVRIYWTWLVLGWVTAWEHHMPLAFHSGSEADHSLPSNAEVKERVDLYLHSLNTPSWRDAQEEHKYKFTFTFYLHY
jgi:hypothetical protein